MKKDDWAKGRIFIHRAHELIAKQFDNDLWKEQDGRNFINDAAKLNKWLSSQL